MFRKFGNILVETDEISALIGRLLVMKNGKTHGIDEESANAMREAFTPHSCNNRHERSPDISHKATGGKQMNDIERMVASRLLIVRSPDVFRRGHQPTHQCLSLILPGGSRSTAAHYTTNDLTASTG